jgi:hypothetical protein
MRLFHGWAVRLTIISLTFCQIDGIGNDTNQTVIHRGIHKRGLFYPVLLYPFNACTGILVAIAIPLNLPGRNVFLSYNYEFNYNMPNQPSDSVPGVITRFPGFTGSTKVDPEADRSPDEVVLRRSFDEEADEDETTEQSIQKRDVDDSAIFTRKGIYRVAESRMSA